MFARLKKILVEEGVVVLLWIIPFGLIYWLATDNLWLCFFITIALVASFSKKNSKGVLNVLLPIHNDIDRYINELKEKSEQLESEVEELKGEIRRLKIKADDIES
jgi:hypothetical protein